jgi:choline dehydrogenase
VQARQAVFSPTVSPPIRDGCLPLATSEPGLHGRSLAYPRGKALGGSSAINAMICMRGQAADYEKGAQMILDDAERRP